MEFGEMVKQLREEKGWTQQTMAEMLYVTRQAVSRWENGARYPDLLTAKKIAQILEVTVDELLSGEKLKKDIEREPLLSKPVENIFQTVLYTAAALSYLLMCVFSLYSLFFVGGTPAERLAQRIAPSDVGLMAEYFLNMAAAVVGLFFSVKNKLTARVTGILMSVPYAMAALYFVLLFMSGQIGLMDDNILQAVRLWAGEFVIPLLFAGCIVDYFARGERRMPYAVLLVICAVTLLYLADGYRKLLLFSTDLGFAVSTVHALGKFGMALLLGYQAYTLDKKKRIAYRS